MWVDRISSCFTIHDFLGSVHQWLFPSHYSDKDYQSESGLNSAHPFGLNNLESNVVGITLTILGAILASLGSIWESYENSSHGLDLPLSSPGGYIQIAQSIRTSQTSSLLADVLDVKFLLGVLIWLSGASLHVLGLFFAPASLLGPVNSVGLVTTLWLSCALLNDKLTWETWVSSVGIVSGIFVCLQASAGAHDPDGLSLFEKQSELLQSWTDLTYLVFCLLVLLFIVLASYSIHTLNQARIEMEWKIFKLRPQYDPMKRPALGRRFQKSNAAREIEKMDRKIRKQSEMAGMLLALLGGTCGSQTVCQIKEVEACWTMTRYEGYQSLLSAQCIWACTVLVVCAVIQFPLISSAYGLADHATVSALYHVSWTLLSVIGGFVKFKEYRGLESRAIVYFVIGLSLTLLATFIAASRSVEGVVSVLGPDTTGSSSTATGWSILSLLSRFKGKSSSKREPAGRMREDEELEMQPLSLEVSATPASAQYVSEIESNQKKVVRSRSFDHIYDNELEGDLL